MTPEEADAKQEWKGMDGSEAFEIIAEAAYEHDSSAGASYDNAVREMMHAWLRSNKFYYPMQLIKPIVRE